MGRWRFRPSYTALLLLLGIRAPFCDIIRPSGTRADAAATASLGAVCR
jgi:hypothetical protein